ncbi:MAG: hypothetical protein A2X18_06065 [Bacteroidetes bacterium GWF2_40_14]|nr:MAG: hypothetical protein A2X18_06065 [Bacteroidetes bacterium GWF2_40_14]
MKIIDLTRTISSEMPVFPGTEPPVITNATTIDKEGYAEKLISFFTHTGTHIDAPAHILKGKYTLDHFSADKFIGKGVVIDVSTRPKEGDGDSVSDGKEWIIEKSNLEKHAVRIAASDFILLRTGWDRKWGSAGYFQDFPTLSENAVKWLCTFKLKGIGFDCISADPVSSTNLPNHRIILGKNLVIIENLCNLEPLIDQFFRFSCLPLKIADSDGSPVRAVAICADTI